MDAGGLAAIVGTMAAVAGLGIAGWQLRIQLSGRRHAAGEIEAAFGVEPLGASVAVPYTRLPRDVHGRAQLLRFLRTQLRRGGVVVLTGMGGVGKSTVSIAFAMRVRRRLSGRRRHIWWVSAADVTSLVAGLVTVARQLGATASDLKAIDGMTPDSPDRLWALLEKARPGWLLLIDNADDPQLLAAPGVSGVAGAGWIRSTRRGLVLVSSRLDDRRIWGHQASVQRVGSLAEDEAALVLRDQAPSAGGPAEAAALARRLGGLPLALHLAGAYLGSDTALRPSFSAYQDALDEGPERLGLLKPEPDVEASTDDRSTIMRTWEISLDDLASRGLPQARTLLRILACYAPALPIPLDLLDSDRLQELLFAESDVRRLARGETAVWLDYGLRGLARLGLIDTLSVSGRRAVVVHPLLVETSRAHLLAVSPDDPGPKLVRRAAVGLLAAAVPNTLSGHQRPEEWPRLRLLTPHLQSLLDSSAAHIVERDLAILVESAAHMAAGLRWSGSIRTAVDVVVSAMGHGLRIGEDHPAILHVRYQHALLLGRWCQWEQAEGVHRQVLTARRRVLGAEHPDTVAALVAVTNAMMEQGRFEESEVGWREVLLTEERVLGRDYIMTLTSRWNLCWSVGQQGRWVEAETCLRHVVEDMCRVLGEDHPKCRCAQSALAWTVGQQGRWSEAEHVLRRTLEAQRRALGDEHYDTLQTHTRHAHSLRELGRGAESMAALRRVLLLQERALGEDHPDTEATRRALEPARQPAAEGYARSAGQVSPTVRLPSRPERRGD